MTPVAETAAVIGGPLFMHTLGDPSSPDAVIARWRHTGGDFDLSPSNIVRITINLQDRVPVRTQTGDLAPRAQVAAVGGVSVTPAHTRTQIVVNGQADVLQLFIREDFLQSAVEDSFDCAALFNARDRELQAASIQFAVAATRGGPDDPLLLSSSVFRIATRLRNRGDQAASQPARGGLARAARQRVDELIFSCLEDTPTGSPTLQQLAGAASLSVNHFIRAFSQQMGVTPHRYVVLRRLEKGMALLKKPGLSIAEIADDVGFATPAHFVATFRRAMGVTPGAFRAAVLPDLRSIAAPDMPTR